ncbi:hypothetical protein MSG28_000388 [Choristoneura fumiferana]|uniref:Uncharacterized protein n=1 Tax=Choristoneura fumiferana TaxID=7141 RepID=A0ACC0K100_CHOFU|nr:hypothetical protein MSG28_000388 [Choristoneura fumiferana]
MVVCSGVKSILDIGKTLEYLETQGVCVCAFGASGDFPAFYTARSGHRAPHRVPTAAHAAKLLAAARALHLASGTVVAVPIPGEYAMDDIALIKNNAQVGADIAVEFNKLKNADHLTNSFNIGFSRGRDTTSRGLHTSSASRPYEPVLIIGGSNVDRTYRVTEQQIKTGGARRHTARGARRDKGPALFCSGSVSSDYYF